jgi:hypothetical protein
VTAVVGLGTMNLVEVQMKKIELTREELFAIRDAIFSYTTIVNAGSITEKALETAMAKILITIHEPEEKEVV